MYFYANCKATILFKAWKSSSCQEMFGSCIIVILLAICYEGLRHVRNGIDHWIKAGNRQFFRKRIAETVETHEEVRLIQPTRLGYFLMLIVMTFNAWLLLSICIGGGVGFLSFNFKKYLELADKSVDSSHDDENITSNDHH
ncbi:hypothetical protein HELRODRAFT_160567 [Helobdella robusta]|uniref:Copper transport protein n=1 Tax=Helobdella robusta TaxID=6412 RepID=T1EQF5_HELRO|nr:hypothetical protein HELRODRAFT_160567 [Helobdella robusta]ESO06397.1 hypothetical protein HELRODRAFT_160567 [Helobdella robusta]